MKNYFNSLTESEKKTQLSKCRFMDLSEFDDDNQILKNKEIVIVGCGAQGLNQGLNMRDSGLNISYALREGAITSKRKSFIKDILEIEKFKDVVCFHIYVELKRLLLLN